MLLINYKHGLEIAIQFKHGSSFKPFFVPSVSLICKSVRPSLETNPWVLFWRKEIKQAPRSDDAARGVENVFSG